MMIVFAADVGSIAAGNFAWARCTSGASEPETGEQLDTLADAVVADLLAGHHVALGFECPLFVPVPVEQLDVGRARAGEGNRAFTAGAGASAAVTGMVQLAWLLRHIHSKVPNTSASADVAHFLKDDVQLFVWEAFVSGAGATGTHKGDAIKAAKSFLSNPPATSSVTAENPFSIAGALLVWSRLGSAAEMHKQCLVIKP